MSKEVEKILLDLAKIEDESVAFKVSANQRDPIVISISNAPNTGFDENETLFETVHRLSVDSPTMKRIITSVISGKSRSQRSRNRKVSLSTQHIVCLHTLVSKNRVEDRHRDTESYKEENFLKLKNQQQAALLLEIYHEWKKACDVIRKPRELSKEAIRGYIKKRDAGYSHDEILDAIRTYSEWARAWEEAEKNLPTRELFWFHNWKLDKFLISDKSFDHVDGGIESLYKEKQIPAEYQKRKTPFAMPDLSPEEIEEKRIWKCKYLARFIADGHGIWGYEKFYEKNKEEIEEYAEMYRQEKAKENK